jgi:starvation-inducible outer membrane lipoprotein
MSKIIRGSLAAALLLAVAACATAPQPAGDPGPAPQRKLDAKTMLECGKRC